jgi:hypothetical protein
MTFTCELYLIAINYLLLFMGTKARTVVTVAAAVHSQFYNLLTIIKFHNRLAKSDDGIFN